jgi:hypothetical protein
VEEAVGVLVVARHLAAVVDVERLAADRTGEIQPDVAAAVEQEAAARDAVGVQVGGVIAVGAHDLAAVVDLGGG